ETSSICVLITRFFRRGSGVASVRRRGGRLLVLGGFVLFRNRVLASPASSRRRLPTRRGGAGPPRLPRRTLRPRRRARRRSTRRGYEPERSRDAGSTATSPRRLVSAAGRRT